MKMRIFLKWEKNCYQSFWIVPKDWLGAEMNDFSLMHHRNLYQTVTGKLLKRSNFWRGNGGRWGRWLSHLAKTKWSLKLEKKIKGYKDAGRLKEKLKQDLFCTEFNHLWIFQWIMDTSKCINHTSFWHLWMIHLTFMLGSLTKHSSFMRKNCPHVQRFSQLRLPMSSKSQSLVLPLGSSTGNATHEASCVESPDITTSLYIIGFLHPVNPEIFLFKPQISSDKQTFQKLLISDNSWPHYIWTEHFLFYSYLDT